MHMVAEGTDRWLVSARVRGEVLTTRAAAPGIELNLLGLPEGYTEAEIESWLMGLARAVSEGAIEETPGDPAPALLRQALGALLFSHGELWSRGESYPCSVAAVISGDRVGFGWVGDAAVQVVLDGGREEAEWISIHDAHGREARAWCGSAARNVRVRLDWHAGDSGGGIELEAVWPGRPQPSAEPVEAAVPESADAPATEQVPEAGSNEPAAAEAPSSGVARWLAQHLKWNAEAPAGAPAAEPATSPPPEADAGSRPIEYIAPEPNEPIEFVTAEPKEPIGFAVAPPEVEEISLPPEVPDRIPPTPEPEFLTAVAQEPDAESTARKAPPRHPEWPAAVPAEKPSAPRRWKAPAAWAGVVLALFGAGWFVGSFQGSEGPAEARRPTPFILFLRSIGLAPPRFELAVASRPEGAWIAVDGKELSLRAPATLELPPGEHRIDLSFPDLGQASYSVRGAKNEKLALDAPLWGSVNVLAAQPGALVSVALDGQPMGFAPLTIDSVAPGAHDLRFSGPGMASWGSTIEVKIGEAREVLAYPLQSPATGLLQIRATLTEGGETQPLEGAAVWVDAQPRGVTPLTLELPRGPHSVRVAYRQMEVPVQVIDLPGGNQRFASFDFGLGAGFPSLSLKAPPVFSVDEPALVSATLTEVGPGDVREMWLHVRSAEQRWRRYSMTLMDAQGSVVGAAPFPVSSLGAEGRTSYYVSAITTQGDEHFTEMQTARAAPATPRR